MKNCMTTQVQLQLRTYMWNWEDKDACHTIVQQSIQLDKEEIKGEQHAEVDEYWTEKERDERIADLIEQQQTLEGLLRRLERGYVPFFEYDMYPIGGCQQFGCVQHGNPEYNEVT